MALVGVVGHLSSRSHLQPIEVGVVFGSDQSTARASIIFRLNHFLYISLGSACTEKSHMR